MKVFGTAENSVRLHPEEHPSPSASNRPPSLHHLHRIMAALHEVTLQSAPPPQLQSRANLWEVALLWHLRPPFCLYDPLPL